MSTFASIPANYRKCQPNKVAIPGVDAVGFPAVDTSILRRPEKIFVQNLSTSGGIVLLGPEGVLADGTGAVYELTPGASAFLPTHILEDWEMISDDGTARALLVAYFAGVF